MGRMMQELELTDTQRKELNAFRDEQRNNSMARHDEMRKLGREIRNLDPQDKDYLKKLKRLATRKGELVTQGELDRGRMSTKFYSILTDEQRQQLLKQREELRQQSLERIKARRQKLQEMEEEMTK